MNKKNPAPSNNELEEQALRESIVSATGLKQCGLQIAIMSDPALRKPGSQCKRFESTVDALMEPLCKGIEDLMINRGIYRIFIAFNSGEISTSSVFDPLGQEVHAAEKLADPAYLDRQFPKISYEDKIQWVRELYETIKNSRLFYKIPGYWKNLFIKHQDSWQPMSKRDARTVLSSLKTMRQMPDYYLGNITICMVEDLIRMQFICDGKQMVNAENYQKYLQEHIPDLSV